MERGELSASPGAWETRLREFARISRAACLSWRLDLFWVCVVLSHLEADGADVQTQLHLETSNQQPENTFLQNVPPY